MKRSLRSLSAGAVMIACMASGFGTANVLAQDTASDTAETTIEAVVPTLSDIWDSYYTLWQSGQKAEGLAYLLQFVEDEARSGEDRASLHAWAALACSDIKDADCLHAHVEKSIASNARQGHFMVARGLSSSEEMALPTESYLWLVKNEIQAAASFQIYDVHRFMAELLKQDRAKDARAMLEALAAAGYNGGDDGGTPEMLWIKLAELLLADGEVPAAEKLLDENLSDTDIIIRVWLDRGFAPVWQQLADAGYFEQDTMLKKSLDRIVADAARTQGLGWNAWLGNRLELVQHHRVSGNLEQAEKLAFRALEVVPQSENSAWFYPWLQNELAYIYEDQGRTDLAIDYLGAILNDPATDKSNYIGNMVNHAIMLWRRGQAEQALAEADNILANDAHQLSEAGVLWAQAGKVCSLVSLGKTGPAQEIWQRFSPDPETNYAAVTMMALCLGETDFAAGLYIKRLAQDAEQIDALIALSQYEWIGLDSGEKALRDQMALIAAREDVQAAVARAGRLGTWKFGRSYWGQY